MKVFIVGDTGLLDGLALWPMAAPGDVLLYVEKDTIPPQVQAELVRLAPEGIVIVGGPVRVSDAVEGLLSQYAPTSRVAGNTRFTTPIEIAHTLYPVEPPVDPPVEPPAGAVVYPAGNHGDITLTDSDVYITAEPGATFGRITLRNVNNVTLDGLHVDYIQSERTSYATNVTVRRCVGETVNIQAPKTPTGIAAPSGWVVEYNDLTGGRYGLLVKADGPDYPPIVNTIIRYNRIGNTNVDGIQCAGYDGLTIHHNEFFGIIENGNHNDGLQSVWGGKNLVFTNNYLHNNRCQPFFIKDGHVDGVVFAENLSIYNREPGPGESGSSMYQVAHAEIYNNTIWDSSDFRLRSGQKDDTYWPHGPLGPIAMHHNVLGLFTVLDAVDYPASVLNEHDNVIGKSWSWEDHLGSGSVIDPNPTFVNWRIDGYGITWNPTEQVYGVAAFNG